MNELLWRFNEEQAHYQILMRGEWYNLASCTTCGSITATHPLLSFQELDRHCNCCDKPSLWMKYEPARERIKAFIKKNKLQKFTCF